MKQILLIIALLSGLVGIAQTDSTTLKLNQYKAWYSAGIIDSQDYSQLKQKALNIKPSQQASVVYNKQLADSALQQMRGKGKGMLIAGGVITAFGVGSIAGLIVYKNSRAGDNTTANIGIGTGVAATIVGAVLMGVGGHKLTMYNSNKRSLAFKYTPNAVGLCLAF